MHKGSVVLAATAVAFPQPQCPVDMPKPNSLCTDGEKNRPRVSSEQLGDSKANDLYLACLGRRRRDC